LAAAGWLSSINDVESAQAYLRTLSRPGLVRTPGLVRMRRLLELLGNPAADLRTVHITGTNGKGSVAATIASICRCAGLKTGLFVSPYLERFGERIQVDGRELPDEWQARLLAPVGAAIEQMVAEGSEVPTEFEAITAMAALYYEALHVDLVVLEAGMGGLRDATNAFAGSLVSVITSVGLDHTERLGGTVAEIAREKAGIIRPAGVVITGDLRPEAAAVVAEVAVGCGAAVRSLGRDFYVRVGAVDQTGIRVTVRTREASYLRLQFPLLGRHQASNVAIAVAVAEHLAASGLGIDPGHIRRGVEATVWPGRSEVFSRQPLVVLDGGHNPDALSALAATLTETFAGRRIIAVLAGMADKDLAAMFSAIGPLLAAAIATVPPFTPRAIDPASLAALLGERFPQLQVAAEADLSVALGQGLAAVKQGEYDMLLVAGSFYLVGAARSWLAEQIR
jgi:dihydrofolate synthase/folylpolyglutamate synthase